MVSEFTGAYERKALQILEDRWKLTEKKGEKRKQKERRNTKGKGKRSNKGFAKQIFTTITFSLVFDTPNHRITNKYEIYIGNEIFLALQNALSILEASNQTTGHF